MALVLVDLRTLDGDLVPAPLPPAGRSYYFAGPFGFDLDAYAPGFTEVERPAIAGAELFACIDQRATDDASYCVPAVGTCTTAVVADALIYPVDASTGGLAGRPWIIPAREFPIVLSETEAYETGTGLSLLPVGGGAIAAGLLVFMD